MTAEWFRDRLRRAKRDVADHRTTALEWDDIQGNILRGYGFAHAHHLVLSVNRPAAARRWLADLVPAVTPATPWTRRPATTLNLAFTHRGLAALGLDSASLASFPADFREGMRARAAAHLGDVGPDAPEQWESTGVHHPAAHVLVMVHAAVGEAGDRRASELARQATAHGFDLVDVEQLASLLRARPGAASALRVEHFGFADGISQPAVEGTIEPTHIRGNGTPLSRDRWRPVRAGEFVLGYPDEEEPAPPLPTPTELVRNGSYLVYRKLAQDVAAFRRLTVELARRLGATPDLVAAKLLGRHPDGSPLPPADAEPALVTGPGALNDVRYEGDPRGEACPLGSHVRRTNPRDGLGVKPELVSRHRLLRRGMPYGPPLPDGVLEDDGVPRGLLFMAYCASICRQFEFVQRQWMNDGNAFGIGYAPDPIAGHGAAPRRMVFEVPGRCPVVLAGLPRLVRVRAGEYLFQPGLTGLRYLSGV